MRVFVILSIHLFYTVYITEYREQSDDNENYNDDSKTEQINISNSEDGKSYITRNNSPILMSIIPASVHYVFVGSSLKVTCKVYENCTNCARIKLNTKDEQSLKIISKGLCEQKFYFRNHSFWWWNSMQYCDPSNQNRTQIFIVSPEHNDSEFIATCRCFNETGVEVCSYEQALTRIVGKYLCLIF